MSSILEDLGDFRWWFSVVIAGLVVNLIAAALWKYVPPVLAKVSDRWAERNEKARQRRERLLSWLMADPEHRRQYEHRSISARLLSITLLIILGMGTSLLITINILLLADIALEPGLEVQIKIVYYGSGFFCLLALGGYLSTSQEATQMNRLLRKAGGSPPEEEKSADEQENSA